MTAAAVRKLQKEIDTVLKKVDDGLGEFEDYWEQANATGSGHQKERLGEELKRSINKLQRFRNQIREWLAQSGVQTEAKDKLEDARKRVECDMQRFKDFERDLKTKAFSTCALRKGDELAVEEAEKAKYQEWITQSIQALNDQLDLFEADLERINNKRHLSNADKSRQGQLNALQEQHRWHTKKLEQVLRAVDNDAVDLGDIAVIRDSLDYYIESCQDDGDCYHDDTLYDCFDLTEVEDKVRPKTPTSEPVKEAGTPGSSAAKEESKEKRKGTDKKDKRKAGATPTHNSPSTGPSPKTPISIKAVCEAKVAPAAVCEVLVETPTAEAKVPEQVKAVEPEEIKVQEDQLLSEAEEFICKICQIHVAGCGPKLTSCSHLFCGDCIAQWFNQHPKSQTWAQRAKSAGPDRIVPCPVCKQPLSEKRDLYPVCGVTSRSENLLLWRMLSSLKIVCVNHSKVRSDGVCDWTGEYGSYQKHAQLCQNAPGVKEGSGTATKAQSSPEVAWPALAPTPGASEPVPASWPPLAPPTPTSQSSSVTRGAPVPAPQWAGMSHTPRSGVSQTPRSPRAPSTPVQERHLSEPVAIEEVAAAVSSNSQGTTAQDESTVFSARAVVSFDPKGPNQMSVRTGDLLQVMEQHTTGWTYAKNLSGSSSNSVGWIPSWVVPQQQPSQPQVSGQSPETPVQAQSPTASPRATVSQSPSPAQASQPQPLPAQPAQAPSQPQVQAQVQTPRRVADVESATPKMEEAQAPVSARSAAESPAPVAEPRTEVRQKLPACCTFTPATASQLGLSPGDVVEIVERHSSGWTYGRKVPPTRSQDASEGWFPDWVVSPAVGQ